MSLFIWQTLAQMIGITLIGDLIEAAPLLPALHKGLSYQLNKLGAGKLWLLKIHQGSAFISQKF